MVQCPPSKGGTSRERTSLFFVDLFVMTIAENFRMSLLGVGEAARVLGVTPQKITELFYKNELSTTTL